MIYVITHKKFDDEKLNKDIYRVLHVGKNTDCSPEYLRDDTGDNISEKNPTYCELTGLYWIWKNVKAPEDEITGLVHYRRFFTDEAGYKEYKKSGRLPEITNGKKGEFDLAENEVILPKRYITLSTLRGSYKRCHDIGDLDVVREAMEKTCPGYIKTFEKVLSHHKGYYFNMVICRRKVLDSYCEWLFPLMSEIERAMESRTQGPMPPADETNTGNETSGTVAENPYGIPDAPAHKDSKNALYQSRVYGFIAERLLQVWVEHWGLKIKEMPVFNTQERPISFAKRNAIRIKYLWSKHILHKQSEYINK